MWINNTTIKLGLMNKEEEWKALEVNDSLIFGFLNGFKEDQDTV